MLSAPPAGVGGATAVTKVAQAAYVGHLHRQDARAAAACGWRCRRSGGGAGVGAGAHAHDGHGVDAARCRGVGGDGHDLPHSRTVVFTAAWVTGMDMTVTLDPTPPGGTTVTSSPCIATVLLRRGADLDQPIGTVNTANPANSSGASRDHPGHHDDQRRG